MTLPLTLPRLVTRPCRAEGVMSISRTDRSDRRMRTDSRRVPRKMQRLPSDEDATGEAGVFEERLMLRGVSTSEGSVWTKVTNRGVAGA